MALTLRRDGVGAISEKAKDHWEYTEDILKMMMMFLEFVYLEAFEHGYKHGREDNGSVYKQQDEY